ncbi:MAG: hypothetical protein H6513_14665 [Acidimicrobiaceae bacterium]|nr:hypothetical protein [Acidimicrobiaceae bacterium]
MQEPSRRRPADAFHRVGSVVVVEGNAAVGIVTRARRAAGPAPTGATADAVIATVMSAPVDTMDVATGGAAPR